MPTITLLNDQTYKKSISLDAAKLCGLMVDMLGDEIDIELPLDTMSSAIMDKVIVFLNYHALNPMKEIAKPITTSVVSDIVGDWDAKFIELQDDQDTLIELVLAGNYLNCSFLLNLGILKIATMIRDKDPNEIKDIFNIDKEITPAEERQVREENMWVFDRGMPIEQEL